MLGFIESVWTKDDGEEENEKEKIADSILIRQRGISLRHFMVKYSRNLLKARLMLNTKLFIKSIWIYNEITFKIVLSQFAVFEQGWALGWKMMGSPYPHNLQPPPPPPPNLPTFSLFVFILGRKVDGRCYQNSLFQSLNPQPLMLSHMTLHIDMWVIYMADFHNFTRVNTEMCFIRLYDVQCWKFNSQNGFVMFISRIITI